MREHLHRYQVRTVWEGNRGDGTADYEGYDRSYRALVAGKPDLLGSADPVFRGESTKHNPEDLFVASISACHMLSYLALCAKHGVRVLTYDDRTLATMSEDGWGGGRFEEVILCPTVTVAAADQAGRAAELHHRAHALCFIANSCRVPIRHQVSVRVAGEARA